MEEKRSQNLLKLGLKLLGSGLALYLAITAVDWSQLSMSTVPPNWYYIPLAFIVYGASQWLSAWRSNQLFKADGIHISTRENIQLYWVGMLYNFLIPGGVGGDGYKVIILKRSVDRKTVHLAKLLVIDRSFGLLGLLTAAAFIITFMQLDAYIQFGGWGICVVAVFIGIVLVNKFAPIAKPIFARLFGISVGIQWLQILSVWLLLWSLFGIEASTLSYGLVFLASSLASVFPLSVGGIGIRELAFVYGARYGQLDEPVALQLSLGFLLMTILLSVIGFPISLKKQKWAISAEPSQVGTP